MPYTPELEEKACTTLRRLSWAIGEPMTTTMQEVFKFLPLLMDSAKVCTECEDKSKCNECLFNQSKKANYKEELFTDLVETSIISEKFYNEKFIQRTKPRKVKKEMKPRLCKKCRPKVEKLLKKQKEKPEKESNTSGLTKPSTLGWVY